MKALLLFISIFAVIETVNGFGFFQEDMVTYEPVLEMYYLKNTSNDRILKATLVYYVERQSYMLPGVDIKFFAGEDSLVYLGTSITDSEGTVFLNIMEYPAFAENTEGIIKYSAIFEGNDTVSPAEWELYIQDVDIEMTLDVIDSLKTIMIRAWYSVNNEPVPVADEDIYFFVHRMFSDLPVGEEFLDENGEASVVFPEDIPGDAEGYVEVIARFDEHSLFGTVEKREKIKWGIPTFHETPESYRALWTQIAPVWMIVTLSILLVGVWSHYLFVIIQLSRIRKMGKQIQWKEKMA